MSRTHLAGHQQHGTLCGHPGPTGPAAIADCGLCIPKASPAPPVRIPQYPPGPYCRSCGLTNMHWDNCAEA